MIDLSVIIITYNRHEILPRTIELLLQCLGEDQELIIVDQTKHHGPGIISFFKGLQNKLRYYNIDTVGQTEARNFGIEKANGEIILFLDDDIVPHNKLITNHLRHYSDPMIGGVAGRIFQPGMVSINEKKIGKITPFGRMIWNFNSNIRAYVKSAPGGNMSFRKELLRKVGGFYNGFIGSQSLEETDISYRVGKLGCKIIFDPYAIVNHLDYQAGGCKRGNKFDWYRDYYHNLTLFFLRNMNKGYFPLYSLALILRILTIRKELGNLIGFNQSIMLLKCYLNGIKSYVRALGEKSVCPSKTKE